MEDKTIASILKTYLPSPFIYFRIDISEIAEGYITDIYENYSTIEIQKTIGLATPKPGFPIELDQLQWMDDNN